MSSFEILFSLLLGAAASPFLVFSVPLWVRSGWRVALYKTTRPGTWFDVFPMSLDWDKALNLALDKFKVTKITEYRASVGPFIVWLGGNSYGQFYGLVDGSMDEKKYMPKLSTRRRLRRALKPTQTSMPVLTTIVQAAILRGDGDRK